MPAQISSASNRIDAVLLVACALVAATAGTMLALDVNLFVRAPARVMSAPAIAHLGSLQHDVRRRPRDMPVWGEAQADEALHPKDFVFTDKGSSAVLTFTDRTTIELGENTLIAIEKTQDHQVLNVLRGSLKAKAPPGASPIMLKVAGQATLVRPAGGAELALRVEKGGGAELTVVAGRAEVGEAGTTVDSGQRARLASAGPPVVSEVAVRLAAPADDAMVAAENGVTLGWSGPAGGRFTVELALDDAFATVVDHWDVQGTAQTTRPLAPGPYYWRVSAGSDRSVVRRFTVERRTGPELFRPVDGQELALLAEARATAPALSVELAWEDVAAGAAAVRHYEVEVAQDASFTAKVAVGQSPAAGFKTPPLPPGQYVWRARQAGGAWSKPARFAIKNVALPAAPALVGPANDAEAKVGAPVTLRWSEVAAAHAYVVEVARSDGSASPFRHEGHGNSLVWTPAANGAYTWRVWAKDDYARSSLPSETRSLQVGGEDTAAAAAGAAKANANGAAQPAATTPMVGPPAGVQGNGAALVDQDLAPQPGAATPMVGPPAGVQGAALVDANGAAQPGAASPMVGPPAGIQGASLVDANGAAQPGAATPMVGPPAGVQGAVLVDANGTAPPGAASPMVGPPAGIQGAALVDTNGAAQPGAASPMVGPPAGIQGAALVDASGGVPPSTAGPTVGPPAGGQGAALVDAGGAAPSDGTGTVIGPPAGVQGATMIDASGAAPSGATSPKVGPPTGAQGAGAALVDAMGPPSGAAPAPPTTAAGGTSPAVAEIVGPPPPARLHPVDGETVTLASPAKAVAFSWTDAYGATAYTVQVGRDAGFDDLTSERHVSGREAHIDLAPGMYYWKIRSEAPGGVAGDWSAPWRFAVEQVLPEAQATQPPAAPPEPPPPPPAAESTQAKESHTHPDDGRLGLALTPTSYHYATLGEEPQTAINATLFDAFGADALWQARPWLLPELAYHRTATVVFRSPEAGQAPGQQPLSLQLQELAPSARLRFGDGHDLWLDVAPGLELRRTARYHRLADSTLTLEQADLWGAALGFTGGVWVSESWSLHLDVRGEVDTGSGAVHALRGGSIGAGATYALSSLPLDIDLGLVASRTIEALRDDGKLDPKQAQTDERSITLGLGLDL